MASSTYLLTKRAFISLLLSLARVDQILVEVRRDSSGTQVQEACRRVFLKARPDNGGRKTDAQRLQVRALCHTPEIPCAISRQRPPAPLGQKETTRGDCGQTVLCHFASRAALLSERLVTASPEPRFLQRGLRPDRCLSLLACSRLHRRGAICCRGCFWCGQCLGTAP